MINFLKNRYKIEIINKLLFLKKITPTVPTILPLRANLNTVKNSVFLNSNSFLCPVTVNKFLQRDKRHGKNTTEEPDSDDEDNLLKYIDSNDPENKVAKVSRIKATSMRLDALIKLAFNISRNKVEVMFYESRIRKNGEKVFKKSAHINIGDEIDLAISFSPHNPNNIVVSRLEILDANSKEDYINIVIKKQKSLTIENYDDPWSPPTSS